MPSPSKAVDGSNHNIKGKRSREINQICCPFFEKNNLNIFLIILLYKEVGFQEWFGVIIPLQFKKAEFVVYKFRFLFDLEIYPSG